MGNALRIAEQPRDSWSVEIAAIDEGCPRGGPIGCRERISDYLRVQWRVSERRDRAQAAKGGRGG